MLMPPPAVTLAIVVSLGIASGIGGYRLGRASADREAVKEMQGQRDAWKETATDALTREREWLQTAGSIQARWEGALTDLRAIAETKPKNVIREVLREGQACPDVTVDGAVFRVLDASVSTANAARSEAPPGR